MAERELVEQEIVELIAKIFHQQFSGIIDEMSDATPIQVVRWVTLAETPFEDLGASEKVIYLRMAMAALQKLRPLLPTYVEVFAPQENPSL